MSKGRGRKYPRGSSSFVSIFLLPSAPSPQGTEGQDSLVGKPHPGTGWEPPQARKQESAAEALQAH